MSKVNPAVCPLMSRSVVWRDHAGSDVDDYGSDHEEYLIEIACLQEKCAFYFHNEEMCSIRMLACAAYDEIPLGGK